MDFALEPCGERVIGTELPLPNARGNRVRVPCSFLGPGLCRRPPAVRQTPLRASFCPWVLSQVRRGLRKSRPPLRPPDSLGILQEMVPLRPQRGLALSTATLI